MESCLLVSFYSVSTYYTVYEACDSRVFTFLVSAFCIPQYRAGTVLYFKSARVRRVYSIHVLWQGDIEHERHIGTYGFTFTSRTLELIAPVILVLIERGLDAVLQDQQQGTNAS